MLRLGTFNVLGLSKPEKQHLLEEDFMSYGLDILAIQETKVIKNNELTLPKNNKLIFMKQTNLINGIGHGGLGFVVSKKLAPHIEKFQYISDRVSFIDIKIPCRNNNPMLVRCINAYSPTNTKSRKDISLSTSFYEDLQKASNVPSRWEVYYLGDFNGKVGKLTYSDSVNGLHHHVGRYGMGTRNFNGECLLDFVCANDLLVTNTCFQHPSRHRTTHTARVTYKSGKKVYSQIDYILCKRRSKCMLQNARSYGGTKLCSDHKLVVVCINSQKRFCLYSKRTISPRKIDCNRLASCKETQNAFKSDVTQALQEISVGHDPNSALEKTISTIHKCAEEVVGYREPNQRCHKTNDKTVVELSAMRKKLRVELESYNQDSSQNRELKKSVNRIGRAIKKRMKVLETLWADRLAAEITSTDDSRAMFEAVRSLAKVKDPKPIVVHNQGGIPVGTDRAKADIIKEWYEKKFTGNESPLTPFVGPPKPLDVPIKPIEVEVAAKALQNGKANGPDNTPNELLKYAGDSFYQIFATLVNKSFEENKFIDAVGECFITPLAKPGKPPGEEKSLRPLTLCNGARKLLSLITLKRIESKIDLYTGPWQAAYKRGRSCSDLVWSQRILTSLVMKKQWSFHKMGLDMSSAFDTIKRSTVLALLVDAGCSEDEIRLVRFLLSNIKIKVKVNSEVSIEFESSIGGPQGDSLSGKFFTLYLAAALYHLRAVTHRPTPPIGETGMPLESEYSDDVDFMATSKEELENLLPVVKQVFNEWNLQINESKTEFVDFRIAGKDEFKDDGTPLRGSEEWCSSKLLGSLMCCTKDIFHRCILGNAAFQSFKKVWMRSKIPLDKKLKVYEAQVVSVIMYNASCWAAPAAVMEKLDICHRKHLRAIMNVRYPSTISNKTLYLRCNTCPLSERVQRARWKLLGHVLRSPENSPAQSALCFVVNQVTILPGRRGRHRINLFDVLKSDLKNRDISLNDYSDILNLRMLASDRKRWHDMFDLVDPG
ncbi:hypothetical protein ACHWQZ_G019116 [Mnemiopsis leidyi]